MKKIITICGEGKYEFEHRLEKAMREVIDSLPEFIQTDEETVVIIELHKESK